MRTLSISLGLLFAGALAFLIYKLDRPTETLPAVGKLLSPQSGFWQNAEPVQGQMPEKQIVHGLLNEVEVYYDERMIPHIFAQNTQDAIFAQGYISAQNRLFQMDLSTRATAGRLSEILGKKTLKRDIEQRRKGMVYAAENAVKKWAENPESWSLLKAYCEGVNSYIRSLSPADYPLEYKLIGTSPEEWSPLKTALFVKEMAASLADRQNDIEATNSLKKWGRDTFNFLYPEYSEEVKPVIPTHQKWTFNKLQLPLEKENYDVNKYFYYSDYEKPDPNNGSNNWVISKTKSATGYPILCGDPHLGLTLPSIWLEMQIHAPDLNVYGVSIPGIPFILIGFNEQIAWSQTNVGHDVGDYYNIKWKDVSKEEYLYDDKYIIPRLKVETYHIKGGATVYDTVRYTLWGPVVYESDKYKDRDLAFNWLAHKSSTPNELLAFLNLNKAQNFEEYYKALQEYNVPAQNFVFADKKGDIALRVLGQFPLKHNQQGRFVRDGSKSDAAWKGFIPKDQTPMVKNPQQGFIASANQHSTSPSYPYYYNQENFAAFRGRTINRFLAEKDSISIQDMMAFQNSNFDTRSEDALPLLLQNLDEKIKIENPEIISLLKNWDYYYNADSQAATFVHHWLLNMYQLLWDEVNTEDSPPFLQPTMTRSIQLLKNNPNHVFWDRTNTKKLETSRDIVTKGFLDTKEKFKAGIPTWNEDLQPFIQNLAQLKPFNRKINSGGVYSALNAQKQQHGASWRQIVELGDTVRAFVTYPGGQSGNLGSPHYDDFLDHWESGKYFEALFMLNKNDQRGKKLKKVIYQSVKAED